MISLPLQSDKTKVPTLYNFRPITLDEVKALTYRQIVQIKLLKSGRVGNVRVGSSVKRWKRDVDRVAVTFKYGLYESARMEGPEILERILIGITE